MTLVGHRESGEEIDQEWLVFSKKAPEINGKSPGYVEVAFGLELEEDGGRAVLAPVQHSPLVVYFPTIVETHLGFLVQGPYRTTPSRDNVPRSDPWNWGLVDATAELLIESLRWLRDHDLLTVSALQCLPIESDKFDESAMFASLFERCENSLRSEALLPASGGSHVSADDACLARTQDLRDLVSDDQLTALLGHEKPARWLSSEITADRTPTLRRYLMRRLGVLEFTPETLLARLTADFLATQPDEWIQSLYEFLNEQPALTARLCDVPIVRLESGEHVTAFDAEGQRQAFLPCDSPTDFPTVAKAVCGTAGSLAFLRALGLEPPDPVDDVIRSILRRYQDGEAEAAIDDAVYEADVSRIVVAFGTDSTAQREKLVEALESSRFVRSVDAATDATSLQRPGDVYLGTERLRALFAGVPGILFVDPDVAPLRGDAVRRLLEACGTSRTLSLEDAECDLSWDERQRIRREAGLERATFSPQIEDKTLRGLDALLELLPTLDRDQRRERAEILWQALADFESRRGSGSFACDYRWSYSHEFRTVRIDAAFVRQLNRAPWVPDTVGELAPPWAVLFESLGWINHPLLNAKIKFKPPAIIALAREVGIEPGVLELLKSLGVTSEAELRARLALDRGEQPGIPDQPSSLLEEPWGSDSWSTVETEAGEAGVSPRAGAAPREERIQEGDGTRIGVRDRSSSKDHDQRAATAGAEKADGPQRTGTLEFISYIAVEPGDEEADPDGLDQEARMALERSAIAFILEHEPAWRHTPAFNPGFDLFQINAGGLTVAWCEVKAMTGSLDDRPVGMSRTQFELAQDKGPAYWLYVVERASDPARARIIRIQDPAGNARTFLFDRGWRELDS